MTRLSNALVTAAAVAAISASLLMATTAPASARIICDRWGHCWETRRDHYPYARYYGDRYYDPYYDPDYDPYYDPYYRPYYRPYQRPGISFGFSFGGGRHWH